MYQISAKYASNMTQTCPKYLPDLFKTHSKLRKIVQDMSQIVQNIPKLSYACAKVISSTSQTCFNFIPNISKIWLNMSQTSPKHVPNKLKHMKNVSNMSEYVLIPLLSLCQVRNLYLHRFMN